MNALLVMIITTGLLPGAEAPKEGVDKRKADETAIRALVQKWADTWGKGDRDAYAALFTQDADYVTFAGTLYQGHKGISRAYQQLFQKGSRLQLEVKSIRFLSSDIARVHLMGGVVAAGQSKLAPEGNSLGTAIFLKQDGEWRITASHVTRVGPASPPPTKEQPRKP